MAVRTASYARTSNRDGPRLLLAVVLIASVCLLLQNPASAATIHKWTDADGVTHYSDQAPPEAASDISELSVPETALVSTTESKGDHYYSIANQWQRMQREGEQRRRHELARQKLRIEQQRQSAREAPQPRVEDDDRRYVAVYGGRYKKRRRGHYPPIKHPPVRPSRGSGLGAFPSIP